jgi:glycosyltransferase involved in cell wall biosynthesis
MATGLDPARYSVAVALGGDGLLARRLREVGIPVHQLPMERDVRLVGELRVLSALYRLLRRERPDIVHLNSSKAGGLGGVAARLARVPAIIFTGHGWAFNEDRPRWHALLIRFFVWVTLLLAHRTICVSHAICEQVAELPLVRGRLITIHNGIPPARLRDRAEARSILSLPPDAFVVGTIAELHPTKGHRYLIEALNQLSAVHACFIGEGELRETLADQVAAHDLSARVHFAGLVRDAPELLGAFDLFVLPSISEALGLVVLEAGAAGLPVIASRVGGIPEIISRPEEGVLVPPRDPHALAAAIEALRSDPTRRSALGRTLQQRVHEVFTRERMIAETEALYRATKSD